MKYIVSSLLMVACLTGCATFWRKSADGLEIADCLARAAEAGKTPQEAAVMCAVQDEQQVIDIFAKHKAGVMKHMADSK